MANVLNKLRSHVLMEAADDQNARRFSALNRECGKYTKDCSNPVLFFNASTRLTRTSLNAAFEWITANSLQRGGVPVHFLRCDAGLQPCLLATAFGEKNCAGCRALSQKMYGGLETTAICFEDDNVVANDVEGLGISGLASYIHEGVPLGELTLPSLRWILRKHHLDEDAAPLHRKFIRSAWSTYLQAKETISKLEPRAIVVFNGLQYPEATVKWLGKSRNIPTFTHEIGLMPFTAIFTDGEATACPIDLPDDFEMTPERDAKLDEYLSKRMKGSFTTAGIQFWPEMQGLSQEFWERARAYRQIVPVFTNVVFDTSQKHANVVFDNMFDWLDSVKTLIENNADTLFVIRAHPDEARKGKESHETVTDWMRDRRLRYLPNVLYVGPEEYLSSYELIRASKFVMVYNSTIGLEASIMGAGVLCAGRSRYTQVPLSWFPQTVEEYMKKAQELLSAASIIVPTEFQQTARRFMYYQFFHTALPFGEFIEPDGVWNGYVKIRRFSADALDPDKNQVLGIIRDGILSGKSFVLPHREEPEN